MRPLVSSRLGTLLPASALSTAILVGLCYFLVGRLFAVPGEHARAWRLAAWAVSLLVFATHFGFESVRRGGSPRALALRVSTAVAIGAFALAVAGMFRSYAVEGSLRPTWVLALVLFPLATAVPAFLVAFAAAALLSRRSE